MTRKHDCLQFLWDQYQVLLVIIIILWLWWWLLLWLLLLLSLLLLLYFYYYYYYYYYVYWLCCLCLLYWLCCLCLSFISIRRLYAACKDWTDLVIRPTKCGVDIEISGEDLLWLGENRRHVRGRYRLFRMLVLLIIYCTTSDRLYFYCISLIILSL